MTRDEQMHPLAKAIITLVGLMGVWLVVVEPMGGPIGQPATQASPGANKLSPPFGEYQAQGRRL